MVLAAVLLPATWPDRADACIYTEPHTEVFEIDPALRTVDTEPPAPLSEVSASVYRNADTVCYTNDTCVAIDCNPWGMVVLEYEPASPPDEELGVRVHVVEGSLPSAMSEKIESVLPLTPRLTFSTGFDDIVDIDAVVTLTVVDRAGNESAESEPITLAWSGCTMPPTGLSDGCLDEERFVCSDDGSCEEIQACSVSAPGRAAGSSAVTVAAWTLFVVLAWFAGRRRRSV